MPSMARPLARAPALRRPHGPSPLRRQVSSIALAPLLEADEPASPPTPGRRIGLPSTQALAASRAEPARPVRAGPAPSPGDAGAPSAAGTSVRPLMQLAPPLLGKPAVLYGATLMADGFVHGSRWRRALGIALFASSTLAMAEAARRACSDVRATQPNGALAMAAGAAVGVLGFAAGGACSAWAQALGQPGWAQGALGLVGATGAVLGVATAIGMRGSEQRWGQAPIPSRATSALMACDVGAALWRTSGLPAPRLLGDAAQAALAGSAYVAAALGAAVLYAEAAARATGRAEAARRSLSRLPESLWPALPLVAALAGRVGVHEGVRLLVPRQPARRGVGAGVLAAGAALIACAQLQAHRDLGRAGAQTAWALTLATIAGLATCTGGEALVALHADAPEHALARLGVALATAGGVGLVAVPSLALRHGERAHGALPLPGRHALALALQMLGVMGALAYGLAGRLGPHPPALDEAARMAAWAAVALGAALQQVAQGAQLGPGEHEMAHVGAIDGHAELTAPAAP